MIYIYGIVLTVGLKWAVGLAERWAMSNFVIITGWLNLQLLKFYVRNCDFDLYP